MSVSKLGLTGPKQYICVCVIGLMFCVSEEGFLSFLYVKILSRSGVFFLGGGGLKCGATSQKKIRSPFVKIKLKLNLVAP